jgi:hypothetical protein
LVGLTEAALGEGGKSPSILEDSGFSAFTGRLEEMQAATRDVFRRVLNLEEKSAA